MKTFSLQNDLMNVSLSSVDQQRFLYLLKNSRVSFSNESLVSRQNSSPVNQNYVCFMNDRELKSAFLSNNLNTVLDFKVTILGKNVGFL